MNGSPKKPAGRPASVPSETLRMRRVRSADEGEPTRTSDPIIREEPDVGEDDADEKRRKSEKSSGSHITGAVVGAVKSIAYITAVTVIGIALAVFFVIPVGNDIFALVKEEEIIDITIPEMATLNDVAEILYENGLIKYPGIFKLYCNFTEDEDDEFYGVYLAGDYSLSTTLNYSQLIESFKPTRDVEQISITIPEGYSTDQIIDLFVNEYGIGTREGFVEAINDYDWSDDYNYWFVDELEENGWSEDRYYRLDGYLFPDTYYFYSDSTEVEAIARLLDNFKEKFTDTYRDYIKSVGMTTDEAVTLASMIQGEAKYLSEYALVSSVFHNRLDNSESYPYLESDATIVFAMMHDNDGVRPDTLTDVNYDSPYNTYTNKGLPPGPICNPGYNALIYAIYPRSTDYFYFVANNDGYSVFSETFEEHRAAIEAVADGTAVSTVFLGGGGEYEEDEEE